MNTERRLVGVLSGFWVVPIRWKKEAPAMSNGRDRKIRISRIEGEPGAYFASFTAPVLGATYAVVFSETITGTVALHRFADMIAGHYGGKVSLQIPDEILPIPNKAFADLLSTIGEN